MRRFLAAAFTILAVLQGCQQIEGLWKNPKTFNLQRKSDIVTAESQVYALNLECDKEWTAELSVGSWATIKTASANGTKGCVTLHIDANGTEEAREDTLTVTSGFLEQTFILRQQDVSTIISNTHLTVDDKRGDRLRIFSGGYWIIELPDAPTWLALDKDAGRGDSEIKVTATEKNLNVGERNTVMRVKVNDDVFLVTVTQKQTDAILADRAKIELGNREQTFTVNLQSNVNYYAQVKDSWIRQVESKGLDSGSVTFIAEANPGEEPRNGTIIFAGVTVSETVYVSQAEKDVLILGSSGGKDPELLEIPFSGGTRAIELRSNVEYDIVMPDVSWLRLQSLSDRKAVVRKDAIGIVVSANVSQQPREAAIMVKDRNSSLQASVTIRQAGLVMPEFASMASAEGFYKGDGTPLMVSVPVQSQISSGRDFEFGRYYRLMQPQERKYAQVFGLPDGGLSAGDSFDATLMENVTGQAVPPSDVWLMVLRTEGGLAWLYDFDKDLGIIARL